MTTTRGRPPRIPVAATRLRGPIWQSSQARMRERWGFDLGSPDLLARVRSLVAEKPTDAERVLLLSAALATAGEYDLAEQQARRAVELAPEMPRAHTTLATLLVAPGPAAVEPGRLEEGLTHARRAAALDGGDATVLYNLGLAEWFAGDRRAARTALGRAAGALAAQTAPREGETGAAGSRRRWWPLGRRA